ncbi:STM3941 family protein [Myceligenerans xiligouense]|nr:STM3941 family protein [Myceligenerans xiligouense]
MSDATAADHATASTSTASASPATGDVVELYPSHGHVTSLAIVSLVLAVVCGAAAVIGFDTAQTDPSPTALVVAGAGAVGTLMALGAGLIAVRRMLVARWPVLIVDDEGFTDWLPNLGVERVEWAEVTGIRDANLTGRAVIAVDVVDPDAVISRQRTPVRRVAAATNLRLVGTPVVLKPSSIDASAEQIRAALAPHVAQG